jgi:hypothetical protein
VFTLDFQRIQDPAATPASAPNHHDAISDLHLLNEKHIMEGIKFKHLRITRLPGGFSFVWEESGVAETLATGFPDLKKGIELLLVAPKNPLLTKTLIEFALWAEENNWDYETLCEKSASDGEVSSEP